MFRLLLYRSLDLSLIHILVDSFDLKTAYGMKLWPEEFGLAGYISVFKNPTLSHPLMISVITTIAGTIIALILSTFGAYVLIPVSYTHLPPVMERIRRVENSAG